MLQDLGFIVVSASTRCAAAVSCPPSTTFDTFTSSPPALLINALCFAQTATAVTHNSSTENTRITENIADLNVLCEVLYSGSLHLELSEQHHGVRNFQAVQGFRDLRNDVEASTGCCASNACMNHDRVSCAMSCNVCVRGQLWESVMRPKATSA